MKAHWLVVSKMTWRIWQIFTRGRSKVWKLDLFLGAFIQSRNLWAWNLQGSYVSWEWKMTQTLKSIWLANLKMTWAIWWNLSQALGNLKHLHFNGVVLAIVYNVWAKKVQRSYIRLHWRLLQILKESWLELSKMTWKILQTFVRQLKNRFNFRKKNGRTK